MSTVEWEIESVTCDSQTFGEWLKVIAEGYWKLDINAKSADDLSDGEKQNVYEFVMAGIEADRELAITFPVECKTVSTLLGYSEEAEKVSAEDVDKAGAEGLTAGGNQASSLMDNPYARFNHHLWRTWRSHFIKGRKESQAPAAEPAAVEPTEPGLTVQQRRLLEIDAEIVDLNPRVRAAQNLVDSLKEDLKVAKNDLDELLEEQADLCNKISIISEGGSYQPKLPFGDEPHPDVEAGKNRPHGTPLMNAAARVVKQKEDPGKTANISVLGMTEKETDLLVAAEINTVAELESRMRNDEWWHKKVKGFGPTKVDKLSDCLLSWRMKNPIPDDDDEPEEAEAEATEEPDTIPMITDQIEWWCCECDHTWPEDGDNDVCPECENESGNQKVGYHGCPDANELGVIMCNYEEVEPAMNIEGVSCLVQIYEKPDGFWISSVYIATEDYEYSSAMNIEDAGSCSRTAAIWNQLNKIRHSNAPSELIEEISIYTKLHLSNLKVDQFDCVGCEAEYCFDKNSPKAPHCPFCGAVEHTPAD